MKLFRILMSLYLVVMLSGCHYLFPPVNIKYDSKSHNPVIDEINLADPDVLEVDGTYYMYPTTNGRGSPASLYVYTSTDLKNWVKHNAVFTKPDVAEIWAPDVFFHDQTNLYYMYYTQSDEKNSSFLDDLPGLNNINKDTPIDGFAQVEIGLAVSDSPFGPFIDKGTFKKGIDAHVFEDEDGELYFYWTRYPAGFIFQGPLVAQKLDPLDPTKPIGEEKVILEATYGSWENIWTGTPKENKMFAPITEGAYVVKEHGKYHMFYSGGFFGSPNYSVGHAISNSPMGPFKKSKNNPILSYSKKKGLAGPGHPSIVKDPDGDYSIVYHVKSSGEWNADGADRYISVDKLSIGKTGKVKVKPNFLNPDRF